MHRLVCGDNCGKNLRQNKLALRRQRPDWGTGILPVMFAVAGEPPAPQPESRIARVYSHAGPNLTELLFRIQCHCTRKGSTMSETEPSKPPPVRFENTVPILRVRDLQASLDYYTKVLGFKVDWGYESVMASVSRNGPRHHAVPGRPGQSGYLGVGRRRGCRGTLSRVFGDGRDHRAAAHELSVGAGDPRHGSRRPRLAARLRTEIGPPL